LHPERLIRPFPRDGIVLTVMPIIKPISMKKNLNILLVVATLLVSQACGKKSSENAEEYAATETPAVSASAVTTPTLAERRAKIEKDRTERAEKRRMELEAMAKTNPTYTDESGEVIYNKAEVDPMYTGGNDAMSKYLNANLVYPEDAKAANEEGSVFVDFVVSKDGMVRNVVVTDDAGIDQSLRMEAIRVVSNMPKWAAGKQRGKAVAVKYSLPITFMLEQ
jgi:TonB family protein